LQSYLQSTECSNVQFKPCQANAHSEQYDVIPLLMRQQVHFNRKVRTSISLINLPTFSHFIWSL